MASGNFGWVWEVGTTGWVWGGVGGLWRFGVCCGTVGVLEFSLNRPRVGGCSDVCVNFSLLTAPGSVNQGTHRVNT